MKRRWIAIAAGLIALALLFGPLFHVKRLWENDPDRYYHLALSRLAVDTHKLYLRSVPQVEDLGWGDLFIDKEFLFHQATNLGYAIAGDRGVAEASFLCAIFSILVFYLFATGYLSVTEAFAVTLLTFSSPYLAYRMPLLRPHTLAILTFVLMSVSVLARRPRFTAVTTALFVLSYHAFYVPLLGMAWLFLISYLDLPGEGARWRRVSYHGIFGCVAGLLANPYFPGNIVLALIHMRIPALMKGELKGAQFGEELWPVKADLHFSLFAGPLLVLFVAVLLLGFDLNRRDELVRRARVSLMYLLGGGAFFLAVSFQIARAGEYLIPICGLLLVVLLERWQQFRRYTTPVVLLLALAQASVYAVKFYESRNNPGTNSERVAESFKAIAAIPAEPRGAKVFNCEWDRSPYLFFARPDLRFVDILDPSLLYFASHDAYHSLEELRNGMIPDAYGLIRNGFHSDYVLCGDPNINAQLRNELGFQQIYPKTLNTALSPIVLAVFRVKQDAVPEIVRKLSLTKPENLDGARLMAIEPPGPKTARNEVEMDRTPYANLSAYQRPVFEAGNAHCVFVSPSPDEVKRLAGADFLGVGGGPGFKVWRNGKPLFITRAGFPTVKTIQFFLPLDPPLRPGDQLDTLVCTQEFARYWGVELSLWTKKGLRDVCEEKRAALYKPAVDPAIWPYEGVGRLTCLGPVAAPQQSRLLGPAGPGRKGLGD